MRRPIALAFTLAALATSCAPRAERAGTTSADSTLDAGARAEVPSPRSKVTFVEVSAKTGRVALALSAGRPGDSLLLVAATRASAGRWLVRHRTADGATATLANLVAVLDAAGTVDLHADGTREAFFVTNSGGSGLTNRELNLYCPKSDRLVTLTMTFMHDDTQPVPSIVRSDELEQPGFAAETAFLEGIKRDYGYVSAADLAHGDDPRQAFYYWRTDNAGLADGAPMRVRRFRGPRAGMGSVNDTLSVAGITYTAYFKSGVVAYDPVQDEHWVVFHPDDRYSWPTRLAATGDLLVIGTRGEGLAVVKLSTLALRRVKVLGNDDVEELAVHDSLIVVNRVARVALPAF